MKARAAKPLTRWCLDIAQPIQHVHAFAPPLGTLGKSTNERNSLRLAIGETHRLFQFCIERFQSIRRLFLEHCDSQAGGPTYRGGTAVAKRLRRGSSAGARSAAYQILWVRSFRDHPIPRRGFNLFKPLRRHFAATPFCCHALSRRDPGDRNAWAPRSTIGLAVSSERAAGTPVSPASSVGNGAAIRGAEEN